MHRRVYAQDGDAGAAKEMRPTLDTTAREAAMASDAADVAAVPSIGRCRHCHTTLRRTFVDLGMSPLCESYLTADQLRGGETFYPLHVFVCERCFLVQLQEYVGPAAIFSEYAYFSSFSDSWLEHARAYCEQMIARWSLTSRQQVIEVASNDGYLLQYFVAH